MQEPPSSTIPSLVVGGVCAGLWCGTLDAVLATVADPAGYPSLSSFFLALLILAAGAGVAYAVLALGTSLLLPGRLRKDACAYSVSLGAFLVSVFTLSWIAGLNRVSAISRNPSSAAVDLIAILILSFLASAGSWLLVARIPASAGRDRRIALAAFLGVGSLSAAVFAVALLHLPSDDAEVVATTPPEQRVLPDEAPFRQVIFLTVDTLRKDSVTIYNPDGAGTPHIDSLANDSIVFDNAFSSAPWTVPAFVSMFTGVPPNVHGINDNFPTVPSMFKTLAEQMAVAGYQTAAIGSQPQLLRVGRGFDTYRLGPGAPAVHDRTTVGRLVNRLARQEWTTEVITDLSIRWLDEHRSDDFFLWLHWLEPHTPYEPPPSYLPKSPLVDQMGQAFHGMTSVHRGREIRTPSEREWLRILYDAEVRYTDDAVGRVLEHLRQTGMYDDALIIFTTDHGEEFWDHGHWEHGHSLYDELVAAPLLIKLPGAATATRVEAYVSTAALLSTILDLCEAEAPDHASILDSLRPTWEGQAETHTPLYLGANQYFEPLEGAVFDGFKYIVGMATGHEELYDRENDAAEQESLLGSHPGELERGRAILKERAAHSPAEEPEPDAGAGERLNDDVRAQLRALGYIE